MDAYNSYRITTLASAFTGLLGIPSPQKAEEPCEALINKAVNRFNGQKTDRLLIYNPDAIAFWLYQKYTSLFADAIICSDMQLPVLSVMPSVTPVCFASMYTGAMPEVHGIRVYEKPIIKIDTLFDALVRAEKKVAIVSTAGDSISKIFLERDMDYFIYPDQDSVNKKAEELIQLDHYDVLIVYNPSFDNTMHRHGPESAEALNALQENINTYVKYTHLAQAWWKNHNAIVGFCPDHGCHAIDGGLGSHGLDMPEDMNIIHFFHFLKKYC